MTTPEIQTGFPERYHLFPHLEALGAFVCRVVRKIPTLSGEVPYAGAPCATGAENMLATLQDGQMEMDYLEGTEY